VHPLRATAVTVARRLLDAGHEVYFAGGCVRDRLMGRVPKDYDLATSALPAQVLELFPHSDEIGVHFGVILVKKHGAHFEIATFRADGPYTDGRHPEHVTFTSAEEDAKRRDFTINGLFENPLTEEIIDYVGGQDDLARGLLRAIGTPENRFREDALRLLRAVRFAVSTGFTIDPETWTALEKSAPLLSQISLERIREELSRIITSPARRRGVELLVEGGLMEHIIPEVLALRGCEQPEEWHPEGDVYIHTLIALELLPDDASLSLCLAMLLHDIAKPPTSFYDEAAERLRFNGHDRLGAEMSEEILRKLRYSNAVIENVSAMVRNHMNFMNVQNMRTSKLKRFMARPTYRDELDLHRADCTSSHGMLDNLSYLATREEEFAAQPLIPPPLVKGADLMEIGYSPGPHFGEILHYIQTEQLEGTLQTREEALAAVVEKFPLRN
jgi:tRNA nucleotidyltransferase/poly(A) polymerase